MRIIGILPSREQVGGLVDSLRNAGFDRKDMIISKMEKSEPPDPVDVAYVKTENDSLTDLGPYTDFLKDRFQRGIVVAVETPKHETDHVRAIMEQNGAVEIIQD